MNLNICQAEDGGGNMFQVLVSALIFMIEWVGLEGSFKSHLVQCPCNELGISSTRSDCSESYPA